MPSVFCLFLSTTFIVKSRWLNTIKMKFSFTLQFTMGQMALLSGFLQPVTQGSGFFCFVVLSYSSTFQGEHSLLFSILVFPDKPRSGAHNIHYVVLARNPVAWPQGKWEM